MIVTDGKTLPDRFTEVTDRVTVMLDDLDNAYHEMNDFVIEEYSNFTQQERDQLSTALHRLSSMRGLRKSLLSGFLEFRVNLRKKENKQANMVLRGRR
jgi:hypothetical protein